MSTEAPSAANDQESDDDWLIGGGHMGQLIRTIILQTGQQALMAGLLGGTIELDSIFGRGSTFTLILPAR